MIKQIRESLRLESRDKIDLIIKPTQACNFACEFCSSNNISNNNKILSLDFLCDYILNNNIDRIIVNGGDPLMVSPLYYSTLLAFIDNHHLNTRLSFTSNLWDFYNNPEKWKDIFRHPKVGVCTSFQYGNERKLRNGTVYTEDLFIAVFNKFKNLIGYNLMFISVINKNNEHLALKHVELAKKLDTECKLNPALASGRTSEPYPLYRIYQIYVDIIKKGLSPWEFNSKEIIKLYNNQPTCCPYNRNCYNSIRCIDPDMNIHTCGAFNDNHYINLANNKKTYELSKFNKIEISKDNFYIKKECLSCNLFKFCNSCYKNIADIKEFNLTDKHCINMKKLGPELCEVCTLN